MVSSLINTPEYLDKGYTGKGVVVAVLDTGFDITHPELEGRVFEARNVSPSDGRDFDDVSDAGDHGTQVASIIAGKTVGIAPDTKLLLLRVAMGNGKVMGAGIVAQAINYAIEWRGPRGERVGIINLSLGGSAKLLVMRDAIKRANANGIIVICAAGNSGDNLHHTEEWAYPAGWPEPVAVASHGPSLEVHAFSNTNPEIDIIAPGSNVRAARKGGGYVDFYGTSCAAPCVSAAMAIIYEYLVKKLGRRPTEPELFRELIRNTKSDDIKNSTNPNAIGHGRLYLKHKPFTPPSVDDININFVVDQLALLGILDSPNYWKDSIFHHVSKMKPGDPEYYTLKYVELGYKKLYHFIAYNPDRIGYLQGEFDVPTLDEIHIYQAIDEFGALDIFDSPDYWKHSIFDHLASMKPSDPEYYTLKYVELGYKKVFRYIAYNVI